VLSCREFGDHLHINRSTAPLLHSSFKLPENDDGFYSSRFRQCASQRDKSRHCRVDYSLFGLHGCIISVSLYVMHQPDAGLS
jgi:hypothetical protein